MHTTDEAHGGAQGGTASMPLWRGLIKLARPHQWAKGAFVLVGPAYYMMTVPGHGLRDPGFARDAVAVLGAFLAFALASSACYVVNDIMDREADRNHPRKRKRPIASGAVPVGVAQAYSAALVVLAVAACWLAKGPGVWWLLLAVGVYVVNTNAYSVWLKRVVILDVISLALGFVLRVLGGCAAMQVEPSSWLINCTFFISMFLAFGKRLGERRTMGEEAGKTRGVQGEYTDDLLRMAVVVTGVACLITYAGYVQSQAERFTLGFNLLWLTMLPATYGLLRCIVLLEQGKYDDPTEIAVGDWGAKAAGFLFVAITVGATLAVRAAQAPPATPSELAPRAPEIRY